MLSAMANFTSAYNIFVRAESKHLYTGPTCSLKNLSTVCKAYDGHIQIRRHQY